MLHLVQWLHSHSIIYYPITLFPTTLQGDLTAADWQYKKVTVSGEYLPQYQFLLDNQVEDNRVGFHVITPLKISGTAQHVLVNRGWVAGSSTHSEVPSVATPSGVQTVVGQVWVPSKKIFSLEAKTPPSELGHTQPWKTVWQHMRLDEYQARVPFSVSTMAINWTRPVRPVALLETGRCRPSASPRTWAMPISGLGLPWPPC